MIAYSYREDVAGEAVCSNGSGVAIFVANRSPELMAEITAVSAKHPELRVEIQQVALGEAPLWEIVERMIERDALPVGVVAVGPDVDMGGIGVEAFADAMSREVDPVTAQSIHDEIMRAEGLDLSVRLEARRP